MAEYNEVIKQFERMCWYYSRGKVQKSCPMCTSYPNCNIGHCRKIAFEQAAHFAATVMRWAKEHPEPVYPTWAEYLMHVYQDVSYSRILGETIPADIAEKLGLQTKGES